MLAGEGNPPDVTEGLDAPTATEPAITGGPEAAERSLRLVGNRLVIDVHDARLQTAGHAQAVGEMCQRNGLLSTRWEAVTVGNSVVKRHLSE